MLAWPGAAGAQEREVPSSRAEIRLSFAPVVEETAPAVVNIYARRLVEERIGSPLFNDPFFQRFFGDAFDLKREREQRSLGSGVILDPGGLIVTNRHVIKGAQEIKVVLSDRREFDAEIALTDDRTDLAVLRIDPGEERLPALELGDSDALKVGDLVLAIGNPFGVGQTVTSGIVSGLARTAVGISDYSFFIQTDAAINPGNSGGALVTLDGKLAGINTAIFSKSGGSVGIGFAIPANMVRTVVKSVQAGGRIVRPWLGMTGQTVTADLAEGLGLDRPGGAIVREIFPGGPADRAGLERGDVIRGVGGKRVEDLEALRFRVATREANGGVALKVYRPNRGELDTRLPLEPPPEEPPRNETTLSGRQPLAGARVANLSPALAEELDRPGAWSGVVVTRVARDSTAARFGFRPGDVLLSVNGREVARVKDAQPALNAAEGRWHIRFRRDGQVKSVKITA
ncbi:DegQ family serine endoprotease [Ferruginivarius sediminum]|uniref:DegQ family serine endoprotease n=2 Tax=Ferruginivarius sediminum TaxID=2661937 RepID=A0A369T8U9_9PROT|nr:DegQ family serine endoprotease [Ferruginivarius sediminum]